MTERKTHDEITRLLYEARKDRTTAWQLAKDPFSQEPVITIARQGEEPVDYLGPDPLAGTSYDYGKYLNEIARICQPGPLVYIPDYLLMEMLYSSMEGKDGKEADIG